MSRPLCIVGSGAVTPVGLSAAQTCAAMRAALSNFAETGFSHEDLEPVIGAAIPFRPLPTQARPFGRLVAIASRAVQECVTSAGIEPARTALLLGVREPYRVDPLRDWSNEGLLRAIEGRLQTRFHGESRVIPEGKAAAFRGVKLSQDLLTSGSAEATILGGVDSLLNQPDLDRFEANFRIKRPGLPRGLIPGEGACFLAVTTRELTRDRVVHGGVLGVGLAEEDPAFTVLSDGHPTGKGLRKALTAAILDADVPESRIDFRISDLSGEEYATIDSLIASTRFYRTRREHAVCWYPASSLGEIGAAFGALSVLAATLGWAKGYAPGPLVMCEASSDGGLRGGCLVNRPDPSDRASPRPDAPPGSKG
ncbi:MAG: hypothetical protein LC745_05245 [Planctomycetia bacterium]|nr:hypothetical protein [Planctomycetia bacterium]